jgi:hypothetical protein
MTLKTKPLSEQTAPLERNVVLEDVNIYGRG